MFSLNPYTYLAGGVTALAIGGSLYFQSTQIHHYHKLYEDSQTENVKLQEKIRSMTTTQNNQTGKSEQNVIHVIQGPKEIDTIVREVQSATAASCKVPKYPEDVLNAF